MLHFQLALQSDTNGYRILNFRNFRIRIGYGYAKIILDMDQELKNQYPLTSAARAFFGLKSSFNSCECIKFLNIANIHVLDVWGKCMFICNNKIFFLCFFPVYSFCNATFFHSGYVIKPPQPSSAFYRQPLLQ